jgi:hypothetical protein
MEPIFSGMQIIFKSFSGKKVSFTEPGTLGTEIGANKDPKKIASDTVVRFRRLLRNEVGGVP